MHELTLEYRLLDQIRPCAANARIHSGKQISQIAKSIEATAFSNPILVDEDSMIIAGHGRLLAAKKLKLSEVPVVVLPGLSDAQKRLLRIADNKIALNATWDLDLLKVEIQEILATDLEIEATGFEIGEIDGLLAEPSDPDEDSLPQLPLTPVTKAGDVWQLGEHRIACGDAQDTDILAALMDGQTADAAFLDPPYNVPIDGYATGRGQFKHRDFAQACGEMSSIEFTGYLSRIFANCVALSRHGAVHFICMDHHHAGELIGAADQAYHSRLNVCVWVKSNAGLGKLYRSQHELVFVYRVGATQHINNIMLGTHGRYRTNVWEYPSVNGFSGSRKHDLALHPTVKPVAMVRDAIQDVTKPGDLVLDAFLGSGTTLIAADRCGRRCAGLEIDPLYVDLILERWSRITGCDPVLEATGETYTALRDAAEVPADV